MNTKLVSLFVGSVCLLLTGYVFLVILLLRHLPSSPSPASPDPNTPPSPRPQQVEHPHRPWSVFQDPNLGRRIEADIQQRTDPRIPAWQQYTPGCPQIDVVYTYVNGSDPYHINKRFQRSGKKRKDTARYRDVDQLRYSLRSVHQNAPWVRHIWIVTDDQVPEWLQTANPHVTVMDHTTIFRSRPHSALPTFNSNAIELNLHHIPGLAECFIYMNDDMFLGRRSEPEDFWEHKTGQHVLYFEGWTAATSEQEIKALRNIWKKAVAHTNTLLDRLLGTHGGKRHFYTHGVYFYKKQYLRELEILFGRDIAEAQTHPFRTSTDVTLPFLYGNYVKAVYPYVQRKPKLGFSTITTDYDRTKKSLQGLEAQQPAWVCINDGFGEKYSQEVVDLLQVVLQRWLPTPSPYEKNL
eukprot:gb/GECH01008325.1/.p1 GENE.gb/GECH01008325.1/~~gb/GECH01008325.1/.p1  ORF type:complete len:408 (+),score=50.15 gb/GECH01008325.1/:1-1224(+)